MSLFKLNSRKKFAALTIAASLIAGQSTAVFAHHNDEKEAALTAQLDASGNIVDNAVKVPELSTLVAAVKAAGLQETLSGAGPFTVLAPVNDAFSKLPAGTVENLLKPENKADLTALLTYHVIPGNYSSAQLAELASKDPNKSIQVKTVNGAELTLTDTGKGGHWTVTDAKGGEDKVLFKDLKVANGTIFTVDKVLMP